MMIGQRVRLVALLAAASTFFASLANGQATETSTSETATTTAPTTATTATESSSTSTLSSSASSSVSSSTSSASPTATPHAQSVFVSPDQDLVFGITMPDDSNTDLYFTIATYAGTSWAAVGLGSNVMQGALVLMIYADASGNNVTFSPRLASGNHEPTYYPDLQVETLNGTGIYDDIFVFSGRCSNCRNWPDGYIDHTGRAQNCIFAMGPDGWVSSDDPAAPLKYHEEYGTFTIDLNAATGPAGAPAVDSSTFYTNGSGTTLGSFDTDNRDWGSSLHAFFMVVCWLILLPFGVLVLRSGNSVRWHVINQGVAGTGVLIGAGLGIYISFLYNRSRSFTNPHQLIGIIAVGGIIAQLTLGFLHHRTYAREQRPTKFGRPHIWLGRVLIVLGIVNAFLGYPLALTPGSDWFLGGLVLIVAGLFAASIYWRGRLRQSGFFGRRAAGAGGPGGLRPPGAYAGGYAPEPLRRDREAAASPDNPFDDRVAISPYDEDDEEEQGITGRGRSGGGAGVELRDLSPRPDEDQAAGGSQAKAEEAGGVGGGLRPQQGRRLAGGPSSSAVDLGTERTPAEYV